MLFSFSYPCVLCLVFDENNNVVLQKSEENGNYGGVAGFIKEGETAEDAVKREIEEEVGLIVNELKYVKSYGYSDRLMLGFFCKAEKAELRISEKEVYSAGWFPAGEAQDLVRQGSVGNIKITLIDFWANPRECSIMTSNNLYFCAIL